MHAHTNEETRTVANVENDIERVQSRLEALREEQADIAGKLNAATDDNALLSAALDGKSIATTQRVGKLEARAAEITEMIRVLDARQLRLQRERSVLKLAEIEERIVSLGEDVAAKEEAYREAETTLNAARNEVYYATEERRTEQEVLWRLENALYAADPEFAAQQDAQRQREAENVITPEQQEAVRREMMRMSSLPRCSAKPKDRAAGSPCLARRRLRRTKD
jgi:chromosome segregation ATPase